jgi:hypothetical protein
MTIKRLRGIRNDCGATGSVIPIADFAVLCVRVVSTNASVRSRPCPAGISQARTTLAYPLCPVQQSDDSLRRPLHTAGMTGAGMTAAGRTSAGAAIGRLTSRWLAALPLDRDTVVSGAGLWPLLALLAGASDGPARDELSGAAGMDADTAAQAATEVLAALDASPDIAAAIGTWTRPRIELHEWWRAHVPAASIGELTTRAALDAWARERTGGLIEHVPIELTDDVLLVLATALLLRTSWTDPFTEQERPGRTWLRRTVSGVEDVHTVAGAGGAVTVATVRGEQDVDVLLGLGAPQAPAAEVLSALLTGNHVAGGTQLLADPADAPGVQVRDVRGAQPKTALTLPAFEVRSQHDLLERADVLGLRTASERGGFSRLSATPTRVDQAAQEVMARFFATGFEAAAVTSFGMRTAAVVREPMTRQLEVTVERPFGFAAVHRPTGIPVVAGWTADL